MENFNFILIFICVLLIVNNNINTVFPAKADVNDIIIILILIMIIWYY